MMMQRIIVPLVLLMAVAAMGQAGIVKAWDSQGQGWDGGGCCGGSGGGYQNNYLQSNYPQQPGPGAYENGYNTGISDAVYDHNNGLAYNPVGNCLPCHSQVYRDGFHHGYDIQWNSYQVQNTDQRVINYINVWGNNNYVNTDTRQSSNQGQGPIPPIPLLGPDP